MILRYHHLPLITTLSHHHALSSSPSSLTTLLYLSIRCMCGHPSRLTRCRDWPSLESFAQTFVSTRHYHRLLSRICPFCFIPSCYCQHHCHYYNHHRIYQRHHHQRLGWEVRVANKHVGVCFSSWCGSACVEMLKGVLGVSLKGYVVASGCV